MLPGMRDKYFSGRIGGGIEEGKTIASILGYVSGWCIRSPG